MRGQAINAGQGHENGDVEQSHNQFKRKLEQALLVRGSRDFATREEYEAFLQALCKQFNAGRQQRLAEERTRLRPLPERRLESFKRLDVMVSRSSTIAVERNLYSVPARLIGESVEARLSAGAVQAWYGQQLVLTIPRLCPTGAPRTPQKLISRYGRDKSSLRMADDPARELGVLRIQSYALGRGEILGLS